MISLAHCAALRRLGRCGGGAIAILACAAWPLMPAAAAFPDKPVRIVVPFASGGGTDAVMRTLGVGLAQALGKPVIVENKPGGGTIIGSELVAGSAPDGYTLRPTQLAAALGDRLLEAEINPLFVLPQGQGVRAADGVAVQAAPHSSNGDNDQ